MAMSKWNENTNKCKKKENRSLKSRGKIIMNTREIPVYGGNFTTFI